MNGNVIHDCNIEHFSYGAGNFEDGLEVGGIREHKRSVTLYISDGHEKPRDGLEDFIPEYESQEVSLNVPLGHKQPQDGVRNDD